MDTKTSETEHQRQPTCNVSSRFNVIVGVVAFAAAVAIGVALYAYL